MITGWTHGLGDPVLELAERVFYQRQSRRLIIDPDLLGEPGWDILLCAFVASGRNNVCRIGDLAEELQLSLLVVRGWIERLSSQEMVCVRGEDVVITKAADDKMRRLFGAQLSEIMNLFGSRDGTLKFSSRASFRSD